jgi:small subunit ribosomal protein S9
MKDVIVCSGKRKRAIAKAVLKKGIGNVKVNGIMIDNYAPKLAKFKILEPLILIGEDAKKINLNVKIIGGGVISQAEAARLAISRALVEFNKSYEEIILDYDRKFLAGDVRRKEQRKPNRHGKARAKRQKSYR